MKTKGKSVNNKIGTDSENYEEYKASKLKNININNNLIYNNVSNNLQYGLEGNEIDKIKEVFSKSKNLKIEIISSSIGPQSSILIINPLGLENGKRNIKDGISYFGYEENITNPTIDYLINPRDKQIDERFKGKHFQIRFNPLDLKYYLKDLGHGFGTFIKIINSIEIKNNFLLNIGENYIVFTIGLEEDMILNENFSNKNSEDSENILNVKIFSSDIKHGILSFSPLKSPITIGRSPNSDILIDDNMLSRIHCTVQFINGKWFIQDGSINQNGEVRKSTNGTWIYAYEEVIIVDKMTFKANHNLFICSYIDSNEKMENEVN
jgi:hypothetical protein